MIFSILIFIFTLLILVLIHELGHFLVAKRFGIKVEEFGFGIPPRIFGKKIGETIYSLNALPIGGFVRLLGEDEVDKKVLKNPRSFAAKSPLERILVVVAGVVMNLLLSWVLFYIVIISQNFLIIYPSQEQAVFIREVEKGFPAQSAGINIGDKLLSVDQKPVKDFNQARDLIRGGMGKPVNLSLSNSDGGNLRTINITPKKSDNGDYLIGVVFSQISFRKYSTPVEKLFSGITYSYDLTRLTFVGLGKTLSDLSSGNFGKVSQSVSGPVGMATMTNDILSGGSNAIPFYIWFVGIISLTLSIFNVLPIPALDGGRLLFIVIEAISGKKVKADVEKIVHTVGFVVLLFLALLVTYSDISKLIH